jgi:hypothetical protein
MLAKFPFGGEPSRASRDASKSGAARIANGGRWQRPNSARPVAPAPGRSEQFTAPKSSRVRTETRARQKRNPPMPRRVRDARLRTRVLPAPIFEKMFYQEQGKQSWVQTPVGPFLGFAL